MKRQHISLLIILCIVALFSIFQNLKLDYKYELSCYCSHGSLDLSYLEYDEMLCALDGEWIGGDCSYVLIPDALSEIPSDTTKYSLHITLPEAGKYYTITVPRMNCSYRLLVDNDIIYENGSFINEVQKIDCTRLHTFYSKDNEIDITLLTQSSAPHIMQPQSILLGAQDISHFNHTKNTTPDYIYSTILFWAAIYFFCISFFQKDHKKYYSFGLLCLVTNLRLILMNSVIFANIFPNCPDTLYKIMLESTPALICIFTMFHARSLFPKYSSSLLYTINILTCFIYMIAVNILPYEYFRVDMLLFLIMTLMALLFLLNIIYCLFRFKQPEAVSFTISTSVIVVASAMDSFSQNTNLIYGYSFTNGMLFIIVFQTYLFLHQSRNAYEREQYLSESYNTSLRNMHKEETNFLSSHLKPHFLFNALNIISGYALFDSEKSKAVTNALIIYLKQLFEHDNLIEMNTLENEINLAKAFGYIESERFPEMTIIYDFPEEYPNIMVPSLLLQPLLENAVNHGIRKKSSKSSGKILLSVKATRYYLEFCIKDDGIGADKETISKALSKPEDDRFHSLYHIQLRLKELYHENMIIRSIPHVGTIITFKIPLEKK